MKGQLKDFAGLWLGMTLSFCALAAHGQGWPLAHRTPGNNPLTQRRAVVSDVSRGPDLKTAVLPLATGAPITTYNNLLFVPEDSGTSFSKVVALRASDATVAWSSPNLEARIFSSVGAATVDSAGAVYYATGKTVYKLDGGDGHILWSTPISAANTAGGAVSAYQFVNSSPQLGAGKVFVETFGGFTPGNKQIVALSQADGSVAWFHNDTGQGDGTPAFLSTVSGDFVYSAGLHSLRCYDAASGALQWDSAAGPAVAWTTGASDIFASATVADGRVYMAGADKNFVATTSTLVCADAITGSKIWQVDAPVCDTPPLVMNGKVYIYGGGFPGTLAANDEATGATVFNIVEAPFQFLFRNYIAGTPDKIYMTDNDRLMLIDPATGSELSEVSGEFTGPVTIGRTGTLYTYSGAFGGPQRLMAFSRNLFPLQSSLPFTPAAKAVDGATLTGFPSFAFNTQGSLQATDDGLLSMIFWEDQGEATPLTPSRVWTQNWSRTSGWGAKSEADDSSIGARQPTMLRLDNGKLLAAWYDYRNTTALGSFTDNIEVYGDVQKADGTFNDPDVRLTDTGATSTGDNSYVPQLAKLPDGRVVLVWYDFHWDTAISEIALRVGNADGSFAAPPPIDSLRITNGATRAAGDAAKAFTFPSVAPDTGSIVHVTWTTGTTDQPSSLYYGRYDVDAKAWVEGPIVLRTNVRGHFDPPRLAEDPISGDLWISYVDLGTGGNSDVYLMRRISGADAFDAPVQLTNGAGKQNYTSVAVDRDGRVHAAYVDQAASPQAVNYAIYDPATGVVERRDNLTAGRTGLWQRTALTLDTNGFAFVAWEERNAQQQNTAIWFATNRNARSAAEHWELYR